jgi:amidase
MKKISTFDTGILGNLDATEVALKIREKEFSAEEAVECATERAKVTDSAINAIVNADYDHALKESKMQHTGIFAGVPTFIKDLNDVKGLPTLKGSSGFKVVPAKKNDKIIDQLLSVTGSIILGKSSTSEFGLLPCGETLQHGETRNPWNTDHSTGGSSAGAAALVAAGVVPFAHASDGGGSIRIPASCCGLVGLKPSRGRNIISASQIVPIDIAQDGIVSRTVRDTAGYIHGLEVYHKNEKLLPIGLVNQPGKKRLRIGLFTKSSTGVESHTDVTQTVLETGKLLEQLGHEVSYINNPFEHKITRDFMVYWSFLSFASMLSEYATKGFSFNHFKTAKFTKQLGGFFPLISVRAATSIRNLKNHTADYNKVFEKYDVLLSPTLSHPAPPIGHFGTEVDTIDIIMKLNSYVNFTTTQNITGAPAISLPLGLSRDGLPIGVQLAAMLGEERILLELAFELEVAKQFTNLANL